MNTTTENRLNAIANHTFRYLNKDGKPTNRKVGKKLAKELKRFYSLQEMYYGCEDNSNTERMIRATKWRLYHKLAKQLGGLYHKVTDPMLGD